MVKVPKGYFEGIKCHICGGSETYIYRGRPIWYNVDNKKVCYNCKKDIDRNSIKEQRMKNKSPYKKYKDGDTTYSEYLVELSKKKGLYVNDAKEYRDKLVSSMRRHRMF